MKPARFVVALVLFASAALFAQSIDFPYRGRQYSMVSKQGITVMIAPMDLSVLNYSAAHVWVTNGSDRPIHLEPQSFATRARTFRQPAPATYPALSDEMIVTDVMKHARMGDVLALVRAYEHVLYGYKNSAAINYYEIRKQMAIAEGGGRKFRAAATVSAIVLPKADIPPGEFREGTIFFATGDRKAQMVSFSARVAGYQFEFTAPAKESSSDQ